jgi:MSHA pilin protein MshD
MGTGQMMLTIGAIVLLSTLMLRINTHNLQTDTVRAEAGYGVIATSIVTSIIEEAKSLAFDEETDSNAVTTTSQLTSAGLLGPENGETYETFNDFDDFDGYTRIDSSMPSAVFEIYCEVYYIHQNTLMVKYHSRTWHKRIFIRISSEFMADTITQSSIYSYWYFR